MLIVLTYSWNSVLLEKLMGALLIKKFPAFYGTKRIITVSINNSLSHVCILSQMIPVYLSSVHALSNAKFIILPSMADVFQVLNFRLLLRWI